MNLVPAASDGAFQVLGMMSGTSGDGIDGALVRFEADGRFALEWHESAPFAPAVRARLQRLMNGGTIDDTAVAACWMAELYADAVAAFLTAHPASRIDAIAAHGQTLAHIPQPLDWDGISVRATLQALNPSVLSQRTGLPVISDFRARDMAVGGQGAPLVPLGDLRFFGPLARRAGLVILNVGGIANVTVIRPGSAGPRVAAAFDTGPGNMLLDALVRDITAGQEEYDRDGRLAASGVTDGRLLAQLLEDSYFRFPPPKSTGRDRFGAAAYEAIRGGSGRTVTDADLASTLLDLTVNTIADAIKRFVLPEGPLSLTLIAGGGALNGELRRRLAARLSGVSPLGISDEHGVPVQAREAMAFAALGDAFLRGRPGNIPVATGASAAVLLGSLTPANPIFPGP
ncbi:MAG TPA: anhydro-N-acetylmuramic acid kinase [Candidatus Ozemobacteraceae bacterium]|nr:anhydro-N-acetylmuramic acid kinase [Candidatus Ozemobacteraceae bacterium]